MSKFRRVRGAASAILVTALLLVHPRALEARYKPNEVLVKFKPSVSPAERQTVINRLRATTLRRFNLIGVDHVRLDSLDVPTAINLLKEDPAVAYAEPNYGVEPSATPNDSLYGQQWHLNNTGQSGGNAGADIDAVAAWEFISSCDSVLVGIIDNGIKATHEDLVDNLWTNPGEIPANGIDDEGNGYVDDVHGYDFFNSDGNPEDISGHGTIVASVFAARTNNTKGLAAPCWHAKFAAIRNWDGFDSVHTFFISTILASIQYAIAIGARVTNNSYRIATETPSDSSLALRDMIKAAGDAGQLFVAAAGNVGTDNDVVPSYPASYSLTCILSVAMSDRYDSLVALPVHYCGNPETLSNYGVTSVDLAAPGCDICVAYPGGPVGGTLYDCPGLGGTSLAAPLVTAAAALLWAQNPTWNFLAVKNRILATVDLLPSLSGKVVTGGRLNLRKALDNQAPAAVVDLGVVMGRTTAAITWTAPGDNGNQGTATIYDLRYSTSTITDANFASASGIMTDPPGPSGTEECARKTGLTRCTNYYFALKTRDQVGNVSPLSNVVHGYKCDNSYSEVYCDEGNLMGGGGGGEESAVSRGLRNASAGSPTSAVSAAGKLDENSLLWGAEGDEVVDLIKLPGLAGSTGGQYHVCLREIGCREAAVDQLSLGSVDHDPDLAAVSGIGKVFVGSLEPVSSVTDFAGKKTASLPTDSVGAVYSAKAGEHLIVNLGDPTTAPALVIESNRSVAAVSTDSVGILVQKQDKNGDWTTLATVHPRREFDRSAVDAEGNQTLRLVFLRDYAIRSLDKLTVTGTAVPTPLALVSADHSKDGSVNSAIDASGGAKTTLLPGDTLNLTYAATPVPEGMVRDLFLTAKGSYASATTSSAATLSDAAATAGVVPTYVFALGPARPNPSLGSVSISYTMAKQGPVSIRLYNVAGKLVRTLASGTSEAGPHDLIWNATDDGGRRVAAGVYFYRMDAGAWRSQRKVVFLEQ